MGLFTLHSMDRSTFLNRAAAFAGITMLGGKPTSAKTLGRWFSTLQSTPRMPVLFLGHGSPMNALEENEFVQGFRNIAAYLPKPNAILCISAHWETKGTYITAMEKPRTIHDFRGFPQALFEVQYPAPGSPVLAAATRSLVKKATILEDDAWGLDHGTWSVLKHLFPHADIPVVQLSLDYTQSPSYHYQLASELASLRDKGVLIIGSGNMVHNLRLAAWERLQDTFGFDWANEASDTMRKSILENDIQSLIHYSKQGKSIAIAVPTPEHFMPLLYAIAQKGTADEVQLFNDKPVAGSISMTSLLISHKG